MKHPALTRIFAIVLAILSLVMLVAGAFGLNSARADREDRLADAQRLQGRIDEYREVSQALEGTVSYAESSKTLEERQEQHDSDASQHRSDLAMYSATKGGLETGREALWQAGDALEQGWEQFNAGYAQFEPLYNQYLAGRQMLATVDGLTSDLTAIQSWTPPEFPQAQPQTTTEEQTTTGETDPPEEPDPPEELPEEPPKFYSQADILNACEGLKQGLTALEKFVGSFTTLAGELGSMGGAVGEMPSMDPSKVTGLLQSITDVKDQIEVLEAKVEAAGDPIPEDAGGLFAAAYAGLANAYEKIQGPLVSTVGPMIAGINAMLAPQRAELEKNAATVEAAKAQLDAARAALEQGDAQLHAGWDQIWQTIYDLEDQQTELQEEKTALEQDAQDLAALEEEANKQEELEKRETSLRMILMDREGIEERVDGGMELLESAEACRAQLIRDGEQEYQRRFAGCLLMIIGGLAGLVGIPAAFEKPKSRFLLIAPVLLCLACAAAAEALFEWMGRGSSYSAIFAGIFAAVQLLIVTPRVKKPAVKTEE